MRKHMLRWLRLQDGGSVNIEPGDQLFLKCVYWGDNAYGFHSNVVMLNFERRMIC